MNLTPQPSHNLGALDLISVMLLGHWLEINAVTQARTYRKMAENPGWETAYNAIAIPSAAGLFVHWGITLPMSIVALATNLSTVIVAVNPHLLSREARAPNW